MRAIVQAMDDRPIDVNHHEWTSMTEFFRDAGCTDRRALGIERGEDIEPFLHRIALDERTMTALQAYWREIMA